MSCGAAMAAALSASSAPAQPSCRRARPSSIRGSQLRRVAVTGATESNWTILRSASRCDAKWPVRSSWRDAKEHEAMTEASVSSSSASSSSARQARSDSAAASPIAVEPPSSCAVACATRTASVSGAGTRGIGHKRCGSMSGISIRAWRRCAGVPRRRSRKGLCCCSARNCRDELERREGDGSGRARGAYRSELTRRRLTRGVTTRARRELPIAADARLERVPAETAHSLEPLKRRCVRRAQPHRLRRERERPVQVLGPADRLLACAARDGALDEAEQRRVAHCLQPGELTLHALKVRQRRTQPPARLAIIAARAAFAAIFVCRRQTTQPKAFGQVRQQFLRHQGQSLERRWAELLPCTLALAADRVRHQPAQLRDHLSKPLFRHLARGRHQVALRPRQSLRRARAL
eukprot:4739767-Pleurochrysis_carterae.AAC.2